MERIEQILWDKTADELTRLCKIAQIKGRSGYKDTKVEKLCEFYSNENWAKEIYESLSKCDKEIMKCMIQNKYHPDDSQIEAILKKNKSKNHYYSSSYFDTNSKAKLFFIEHGRIPSEFRLQLDKLVKPLKVEIKPIDEKIEPEDFYANIVGRDNRVQDIDEFIKFINVNKIKATKAKEQMPKSSILKIYKTLQYGEILRNDEIEIDNIRNIEDTIITNSIMNLLTSSLIIRVKKGQFYVEELFCEDYQKLNKVEKVQFLLDKYTREDSIFINECDRIQSANFHIENRLLEFGRARKIIIEYLKKCPINEWIDMSDFKKCMRINEYGFLRPYTGEVLIKDQYYNEYYQIASHNELENSFIDIVFMEYLATLGIVDVVLDSCTDEYGYKEFLSVEYFKITEFGSYVLGSNKDEYDEKNTDNEIMVTDNFEIVIGETNQKLKYELYFDRFLKKKSEKPLMYKLDFKGMVKALELKIKIKEIYDYLQENCIEGIPKNVNAQFETWIRDSKRIKIKTLTVLEVDRENFKEIVGNQKMRDYIDSVRSDVIVLKNSKVGDVRKELEKNRKFCI